MLPRGCRVATSDPIAEIIGGYRAFAAMPGEPGTWMSRATQSASRSPQRVRWR